MFNFYIYPSPFPVTSRGQSGFRDVCNVYVLLILFICYHILFKLCYVPTADRANLSHRVYLSLSI